MFNYEFSPNQLQALSALIKEVLWDAELAEAYTKLPEQLRQDIKMKSWECNYTFAHTRHWCGNDTCRES